MKTNSLLLLFVTIFLCFTGCADSHDKAVRDSIQIMDEMAAIVESVDDEASAKAAAKKLEALKERSISLKTRIQALNGEPSQDVAVQLQKKYQAQIDELKPKVREFGSKLKNYPVLYETMEIVMDNGAPLELKGMHKGGFGGNRENVQSPAAMLKAIESATKMFKLDYGYFPKNLADLTSPPAGISQDKWRGPYLKAPVTKDSWGTDLQYSASALEDKVSLVSAGPDRQFNTADDIRN